MSDTVLTQRGQALNLACTFYEEGADGVRLDLTGATVMVRECNPPVLGEAAIAVTDAGQGEVSLSTTEVQSDQLGAGRVNWFRLEAQFAGGENIVTPKIWISVQ